MSNWKKAFWCFGCHNWHTIKMEPETYNKLRDGNKQALRGYDEATRDLVNNGIHPDCEGKQDTRLFTS